MYPETTPWWRDGDGKPHHSGQYPGQFFFVSALTGRAVCNFGFIERPLVLGFLWWLATGDFSPALPLALFFELFWLDLIPIGSYLPPMPAFPYLALLALSGLFDWTSPANMVFPLAVSLPLAYLAPYAETRQRNMQKAAFSRLLGQARKIQPLGELPGRLLAVSALQQWCLGLLFFCLATASLFAVFSIPYVREISRFPLHMDWSILYAIGAIGALMALRVRRIYLIFTLGMAVALLMRFFA